MKKLLFALCALAAFALLTPSAGFAQWENRIGIYSTSALAATSLNPSPANDAVFSLYFVLTNPTVNGSPVVSCKGWEYRVTIVGAAGGLERYTDVLPAGAQNFGNASDPYDSSYALGLATPLPVTIVNDLGRVVLHRWSMHMVDNAAPYYFYLSPASPASFPGRLAYLNGTGGAQIAASGSQGNYADPVFVIGGQTVPVATQSESFGAVKALFR